eukprot:scaffold18823_cov91-Skeletonema_menzelii.AAC.1
MLVVSFSFMVVAGRRAAQQEVEQKELQICFIRMLALQKQGAPDNEYRVSSLERGQLLYTKGTYYHHFSMEECCPPAEPQREK